VLETDHARVRRLFVATLRGAAEQPSEDQGAHPAHPDDDPDESQDVHVPLKIGRKAPELEPVYPCMDFFMAPRRYMPRLANTYGIVLSRIFTSVHSDQLAT
jgi:hypothetical protein